MKVRRFKVDEWVYYCPFPKSNFTNLKEERQPAVILEVLDQKDRLDYRIFIDDGTSTMRKVKEESLFPHQKTK
tara:strand:+ start:1349 stop:1567 length:219 start_codon:yes stop_codon:yes gene_type:complete